MGDSDKLDPSGPERYAYAEHRDYPDALWEALDLGDRVVLVVHDWGSVLGFDWARRHRARVKGIAYMDGVTMRRECGRKRVDEGKRGSVRVDVGGGGEVEK